jgi:hypothetical protein
MAKGKKAKKAKRERSTRKTPIRVPKQPRKPEPKQPEGKPPTLREMQQPVRELLDNPRFRAELEESRKVSEIARKLMEPKWSEPVVGHAEHTQPPQRKPAQPERKRAKGGGAKRSLSPDEINQGKSYCHRMLDEDPTWVDRVGLEAAALSVIAKVLTRLDPKSWQTVKRHIVVPVLKERGLSDPRSE